MTWHKRSGHHHDHLDGRTLVHNIHLANSVTGAEHHLQLLLKSPCCAVCRRPFTQTDLGLLDPKAEIEKALEMLNPNHDAILQYAQKHNVPILLGELASTLPDGHKHVNVAGQRFLVPSPNGNKK